MFQQYTNLLVFIQSKGTIHSFQDRGGDDLKKREGERRGGGGELRLMSQLGLFLLTSRRNADLLNMPPTMHVISHHVQQSNGG